MKPIFHRIFFGLCGVVLAMPATAQNQPKGHIFNMDGEKCTFVQTTAEESYLHSLKANTGNLIFDDPRGFVAQIA